MRRHALDLAILFVFGSIVCGYLALAEPSIRSVTLHAYVIVLGALIMLGIVAAAGDAAPRRRSDFDRALSEPNRKELPLAEFEKLQREVALASASAYDLHRRLLPQLREIARCRLERTGRTPGPETLGRWWDLLRPDPPEPVDRFAAGIERSELVALVADLERM